MLYGHSHQPRIKQNKGVLYFNPGSCGPRRFDLPVTVGILTADTGKPLRAELIDIGSA